MISGEIQSVMGLRDMILKIASEFHEARQQQDLDHTICDFIRQKSHLVVREALSRSGFNGSLECSGSPGFGNIAYCPWTSILHPKAIDPKTNKKRYTVVYLFSYDLLDVHLCLLLWENGDPFDLNSQQKREHLDKLRRNAQNLPKFMKVDSHFSADPISLGAPNPGSFADFYEAGYVIGRKYLASPKTLPTEADLAKDLKSLVRIYVDMAENFGISLLLS